MPQVTKTEIWNAPVASCYRAITDYQSYPEFVEGISDVRVISQDEQGALVEYHLNLIKKFKYVLRLTHNSADSVDWVFEKGDVFKRNDGSWRLVDKGDGTTEVNYRLDVDVKGFVPGAIVRTLTEKNLPGMMDSFHARAREVEGV